MTNNTDLLANNLNGYINKLNNLIDSYENKLKEEKISLYTILTLDIFNEGLDQDMASIITIKKKLLDKLNYLL